MKLKEKLKGLNKFKIALFIVGFCGAAFYITIPATIVSFILYFGLACLMLPLVWDLLE
jgi:uncharacterized membrane protein YhdT|tara:strand:+ start:468 stop:641 length:174 start_codon:yes stop_codon:yes gene_type:complete